MTENWINSNFDIKIKHKEIVNQILHDISGKATVLSIMNELHSNSLLQKNIDNLIELILATRKKIAYEENYHLVNIYQILEILVLKSKELGTLTLDTDINTAIKSLINLSIGYMIVLTDLNENDSNIKNLMLEKSITTETVNLKPIDLITGILLILKNNCSINTMQNQIIINNVNYDFFKQNNGIITFLLEKYNLEHANPNQQIIIKWSLK